MTEILITVNDYKLNDSLDKFNDIASGRFHIKIGYNDKKI